MMLIAKASDGTKAPTLKAKAMAKAFNAMNTMNEYIGPNKHTTKHTARTCKTFS